MLIGGKKFTYIKTFTTRLAAHKEASRWLRDYSAKVVRTASGRYSVYTSPQK